MKTVKQIYEATKNGDSLTDAELDRGIRHFKPLADLLNVSGTEFRLAFYEANAVYLQLVSYQEARSRKW